MDEFRKKVLKVKESRKHKVSNSRGVYDAYKYIRKNKWFDIGRPLKEHEFYSIIRRMNDYFADELIAGNEVIFPFRMGKLELRKYSASITFKDGKVVTNLPIDWDRTLKLWSEDKESYDNRILVKMEEKELFKIIYNKRLANYTNRAFMSFNVNRDIKLRLKQRIKDRAIDAFSF